MADTGGRLALWYHVYGSLKTKIIQTNNLIITREICLTPREPSVMMSILKKKKKNLLKSLHIHSSPQTRLSVFSLNGSVVGTLLGDN